MYASWLILRGGRKRCKAKQTQNRIKTHTHTHSVQCKTEEQNKNNWVILQTKLFVFFCLVFVFYVVVFFLRFVRRFSFSSSFCSFFVFANFSFGYLVRVCGVFLCCWHVSHDVFCFFFSKGEKDFICLLIDLFLLVWVFCVFICVCGVVYKFLWVVQSQTFFCFVLFLSRVWVCVLFLL